MGLRKNMKICNLFFALAVADSVTDDGERGVRGKGNCKSALPKKDDDLSCPICWNLGSDDQTKVCKRDKGRCAAYLEANKCGKRPKEVHWSSSRKLQRLQSKDFKTRMRCLHRRMPRHGMQSPIRLLPRRSS